MKPVLHDNRGISLIEALVAIAIFALLLVMIDAVFGVARQGAAKAELGADVQQNLRIAVDRLTREIRETSAANIAVGGVAGVRSVAFKSARPKDRPTVFCVQVPDAVPTSPWYPLYNASCFTNPGPAGSPGDATLAPQFSPIWQSLVGYYAVAAASGGYDLRRYVCDLNSPSDALPGDPADPPGGCTDQKIATFVESFDVSLAANQFIVRLKATGQEMVLGSLLPAQKILVEGTAVLRN